MLTPKQERFVQEYGRLGGDASKAYRAAYDAEGMKPETVHKRASELLQHGEVAGRLAAIRAKVEAKTNYTIEQHLERLAKLSEAAEKADQFGPSVKAEELRGKVSGFYVERVEHSGGDVPVVVTFKVDGTIGGNSEEV